MAPVDNRRTAARENRWNIFAMGYRRRKLATGPRSSPHYGRRCVRTQAFSLRSAAEMPGERHYAQDIGLDGARRLVAQPQVVNVAATQGCHRLPIDAEHGAGSTGGKGYAQGEP